MTCPQKVVTFPQKVVTYPQPDNRRDIYPGPKLCMGAP